VAGSWQVTNYRDRCGVPLCVAYTVKQVGFQGHFTGLVAVEGRTERVPLVDDKGQLLPMPYAELGQTDPLDYLRLFLYVETFEASASTYAFAKIPANLFMTPESRSIRERLLK
jgi:hypothetical protein